MRMWGWASYFLSAYTRNNLSLIYRRPSRLLWCFLLSSGFSLAAAEKLFQHRELRKEQASLAWVEMPFSAILYLSIAPAPSSDEIRKVGQWRAKEGCSTGMLEAGREADEDVEERWEGEGCVRKISAIALNQTWGTRYHGLISCYAAPHTQLIVMAVGCEHGRGSGKSKGLGKVVFFKCWAFSIFIKMNIQGNREIISI